MKKISLFLIALNVLTVFAQNENVAFDKASFPNKKEELKEAKKAIVEGDGFYYSGVFSKALDKFLIAQKFNPNNAQHNGKLGDCYLKTGKHGTALDHLKKAIELNADLDGYYLFLLANSYHVTNDFDNAIVYYKKAGSKGSNVNPDKVATYGKKISECNTAKKLVATPLKVDIESVGNEINSDNHEYVPVINADESEMFFTSRRPNTTGGELDFSIDDYYEDIYYSKKENDLWSDAVSIGVPVNSENHDATVGLSIDGQKLFIYRDNEKGDGNIYETEREGETWTEPKELPEPINSKYHETSACYAYTGKTIYFISDRPGGLGGKDIYKSDLQEDGSWGDAINLGKPVNTEYDEDAIFLHADGKTLYFSSRGHETMGGYDIFKTTLENNKWTKPENIGYPINSADDDVCFVLAASGEYGYYTSEKVDGKGKKDIYKITFIVEEKPRLTLLKGIVFDNKTKELLGAQIEIFDNTENKMVSTYKSNSATGKYMVSLPAGHDYGISARKEGYLFYSENISIPDTAAFQEIEKNIGLDKLEKGKKVILMNIFYDYNKASLREASFNELDKVVELLNKNTTLRVELGAHTDSRGSDAYNQKLSQERAQSCVDYLTSKGISKERLVAKGYGETKLLISDEEIAKFPKQNEKEAAHQENRRTEFKILEN